MKNTRKNATNKNIGFGTFVVEDNKLNRSNFSEESENNYKNLDYTKDYVHDNMMIETEIADKVAGVMNESRRELEKESSNFQQWISIFGVIVLGVIGFLTNFYHQYVKGKEKDAVNEVKMLAKNEDETLEKAEKRFEEKEKELENKAQNRITALQILISDSIEVGKYEFDEKDYDELDLLKYYAEHHYWGKFDRSFNKLYNKVMKYKK